eukprot:CCRYP_003197-RA/>CCRYP_003197-RA protein AED:0.00 eAED:0.00 QI:270/1/1/1/0/0/2/30/93
MGTIQYNTRHTGHANDNTFVMRRDERRPPDTVSARSTSRWWENSPKSADPWHVWYDEVAPGGQGNLPRGLGSGFLDLSLNPPQFSAPLTNMLS